MIANTLKFKGFYELQLKDKKGNVKQIWQENKFSFFLRHNLGISLPKFSLFGKFTDKMTIENLVVSAGKAGIASRINGSGAEAIANYLAIGIGILAPAAGDVALGSEITTGGGARAAATVSRITTTVTNDTAQAQYTWTFSLSFAITEVGLLNAASAGTLFTRDTFSAVNVVSGDTLQVTHKLICA